MADSSKRLKRRPRKGRKSSKASEFIGNIHKNDGIVDQSQYVFPIDRKFGLQNMVTCKFQTQLTAVAQQASVVVLGGLSFNTTQFTDITNILSAFDEYQIWAIKVKFIPTVTAVTPYASASYIPGELTTVVDLDDVGYPSTIVEMLSYNTAIQVGPSQSVTRCWRPKISVPAYGAGAFSSYCNLTPDKEMGWIDNGYPSVQHFGLKYGIQAGAAAQTNLTIWAVVATAYCHFRMNY
jgi:hypothetical protein